MGDPFKHVRAGLPFRPNSRAWNIFVDTAVSVRKSQRTGTGVPIDLQRPWIVVRNTSTTDLERNDAIGLNGPVFGPTENLDEFLNNLAIDGTVPKSCHAGNFAILLEDVPAGGFGRALVSGVVIARVNFASADDAFADVASGSTVLESGTSGSAQILWAAARTGTQWCVVRLSNNPDALFTSVCSSDSISSDIDSEGGGSEGGGSEGGGGCGNCGVDSDGEVNEAIISTQTGDPGGGDCDSRCVIVSLSPDESFTCEGWSGSGSIDCCSCTTTFFVEVECTGPGAIPECRIWLGTKTGDPDATPTLVAGSFNEKWWALFDATLCDGSDYTGASGVHISIGTAFTCAGFDECE